MRTFIATFFFAILAFGANAQDRSSDIRSTIESQLKALQQDDFAAAFSSPARTSKPCSEIRPILE